ncbi:MAG: STAS domain-containing protein [Gemmatimonadota bacterium]|nr:STAS domain-containing protein [Gemmatimonadota bacterium]
MTFSMVDEGGVTVVDVDGELIVGNRQELKDRVMERLEDGDRRFLIDFSRSSYIDSSGLGMLVSLSKRIRDRGATLRLAGLNGDLRTLFELTRLDTLFEIAPTRADALEDL